LNEDIYRKNAMTLSVFILLIGLVFFSIGVGWNLKRNMQYYLDFRTEFSNFESTLASGLFNIGLILIIFGIATFLCEYTSKLMPLRNKVLYQLIILLSFLYTLIMEIISKLIQYNAYENLSDIDYIEQLYLAFALSSIAKFGLIIMFIIILVFFFNLFNISKYGTMITPPMTKGYPPKSGQGG
jgi:uncharacterized membrane protein